jgi:hypothetical protein
MTESTRPPQKIHISRKLSQNMIAMISIEELITRDATNFRFNFLLMEMYVSIPPEAASTKTSPKNIENAKSIFIVDHPKFTN